jgi:HEAT repeat protein
LHNAPDVPILNQSAIQVCVIMLPSSFQTNLRRLAVLVASCGVIAWAWRSVEESRRPPSTQDWVRTLKSGNDVERKLAATRLATGRAVDAGTIIPALVSALSDTAAQVRSEAALALGRYVATTLPVLGDQIAEESSAAIKGLVALINQDGDPEVRSSAAFAIATTQAAIDQAGESLEKSAATQRTDRAVIVAALDSALQRDPANRHALIAAIRNLGRIDLPAPPGLFAALDDSSRSVRVQALHGLSQFTGRVDRAIPVLLRDLETEEDTAERRAIGMSTRGSEYFHVAEGLRPSPAVIPMLVDALESPNRNVRGAAAILLGQLGPEARSAAPALVAAARKRIPTRAGPERASEDALFFDFAPALLRVLPPNEAVAILCEALRPNRYWTRSAAASALAKLGPKAKGALPALVATMKEASANQAQGDSGFAVAVVVALGQIAPDAPLDRAATEEVVDALRAGLEFKDALIRGESAEALERFGPRAASALPRLRAMAKDETVFKYVRESAAKAIEAITGVPGPLSGGAR